MNALRKIAAVALCAGMLTGSSFAEETKRPERPWKSEIEAHRAAQQKENQAFRKTLKDKETTAEIITAIKAQRTEQHKENVAFREGIHAKKVEAVKARFAEKEVPADKQKEILAKIEEHYTQAKAEWEKRFAGHMAYLDGLAGQNLTKEQLREKLKEHMGEARQEGKARREANQAERQKRMGERKQRRAGKQEE